MTIIFEKPDTLHDGKSQSVVILEMEGLLPKIEAYGTIQAFPQINAYHIYLVNVPNRQTVLVQAIRDAAVRTIAEKPILRELCVQLNDAGKFIQKLLDAKPDEAEDLLCNSGEDVETNITNVLERANLYLETSQAYMEYVAAKLEIEEEPLTFEQWKEFNEGINALYQEDDNDETEREKMQRTGENTEEEVKEPFEWPVEDHEL